ncbi:MAG: glycosyltransferase family 4 protein [Anaerolineae bacterium]|nr:glycosyltransferase family 4 protein [Anaerolineae bacterium]
MLNITFLTGEYPPMQGGIADYTANLADQLARHNVQPSILITHRWQQIAQQPSTASQSPNLPISQSFGFAQDRSPVSNLQSPISIHPTLPNWGWRCWPAITRFLKQHQPVILHIQYQAAAFDLGGWINWLPWYLKKRGATTQLVTTFHDLRIPYVFPKAGRLRWQSILALARHSDAVICTNREDLKTLQLELNLPHATHLQSPPPPSSFSTLHSPFLTVIPLGTNIEPEPPTDFDRAAWRKKYHANDQTLLLTYFGFLNESKGGEELIEAVALLRQQGIDARLLFIGGDIGHADPTNAAYAERVQAMITQHRLSEVVYRTGYVEQSDVSANLLAADAVVLPYRDGVSFRRTTLIAALRHGCPVVSTLPRDADLIPEIQPDENMLLAPPEDAAELAQVIAQLHGNASLWHKLSTGAKQLGDLFEWSHIATETAKLYQCLTHEF